ncbi:MAG: hypothetical protein ABR503_04095 [Chitinophagaceae bacterium]
MLKHNNKKLLDRTIVPLTGGTGAGSFVLNRDLPKGLITKTWKRFQWKSLLAGYFPVIEFTPDDYLSFK